MPSRLIREGILTSERIELLDWPAEVFYRRLMSKVDDYGLFDARPSILRSSLYPLRVDRVREADIARWIAACETAGVIALYVHGGKPLGQMLDTGWQTRSEPKQPLPPWGKDGQPLAPENSCEQVKTVVHLDVFGVGDVVVDDKKRSRAVPPDGVTESVWKDFLKIRTAKRAPMTDTALAGIKREAEKAGIGLQRAIEIACERGWQSFKADWITNDKAVMASVTVPGSTERDPALQKLDDDARRTKPPSLEMLERMAALRQPRPGAH